MREWLGAMAVARIVGVNGDKEPETYFIPEHRIPALKSGTGRNSMALYATGIPMLSNVYKDLAECFKKDGPRGMYLHRSEFSKAQSHKCETNKFF